MKPTAWRVVLLAICSLAALVQVADILDGTGMGGAPPWRGRFGANTGVSSQPFHLAVTAVKPGGAAARAGLRRGDLIDIRANTLVDRFSLLGVPLAGRPLAFSVHRASLQKEFTVIPLPEKLTWEFWAGEFAGLWLLLFAAVIAWRRADMPQMRLLSLWLAVLALAGGTFTFAAPWAWMYILFNISNSVALPLSLALLTAFASCFARPLSRLRRIAQWLCYIFVSVGMALAVIGIAGLITLQFDPLPVWGFPALVLFVVTVLIAAICGVLAIAASRGVERQRAVWTLAPLAAVFCAFILDVIANLLSSYVTAVVMDSVFSLVFLAAPVALTYAALSRRLIDIGFFLNRAAVFAIVSTIVIGAFVLVEWGASAWLAGQTHATSTLVGMIVALSLGVSLRFIHRYVERFVDRVFFRKRNEDEAALRRFAHEVSYITDRSTLLERTVREVKEHTNAADATILVQNGATGFASAAETDAARTTVSENDPGILALRAWRKPVDLGAFAESVLRGEFAYPMISRGALVGALICGPKHDGEAYAPDESDALLALAHAVGAALDMLSSRSDGAIEALREAKVQILQQQEALSKRSDAAIVRILEELQALRSNDRARPPEPQ